MGSPAAAPGPRADRTVAAVTADVDERFAAHVGVRVDRSGHGSPCTCWASATLTSPSSGTGDPADDRPVPTGAVLALVDATARAAAEAAVAVPGLRATLVPMATGVQFRESASGTVTASANVPCEGVLVDRADDQGVFRFSVAVDVVGATGARVAAGTVQWLARVDSDVSER